MTVVAVTAIIAFFVVFAIYIWDDIQEACREGAADEIGAAVRPSSLLGESGLSAAGADTYAPYDWDAA